MQPEAARFTSFISPPVTSVASTKQVQSKAQGCKGGNFSHTWQQLSAHALGKCIRLLDILWHADSIVAMWCCSTLDPASCSGVPGSGGVSGITSLKSKISKAHFRHLPTLDPFWIHFGSVCRTLWAPNIQVVVKQSRREAPWPRCRTAERRNDGTRHFM